MSRTSVNLANPYKVYFNGGGGGGGGGGSSVENAADS